jgi:nitrogen fixation NifU-like protein
MDYTREELMEIYKNPSNKKKMLDPTVSVSDKNPMCGDDIILELKISNGIIEDASFQGSACSVSIISSSTLTEILKGKSLIEAKKISKDEFLNLLGLNLTTSRIKCATLVLSALEKGLNQYEEKNH